MCFAVEKRSLSIKSELDWAFYLDDSACCAGPTRYELSIAWLCSQPHSARIFRIRTDRSPYMKTYTAVIERCPDNGLYVGYVPGFPGAHSQAETLDELNANLKEVIEMLSQDGIPHIESQFVGVQTVEVA